MADNVIVNIPTTTGSTIATDDVSGVQHQKVKIEFGDDGIATMVSDTDPLPIAGVVSVSNFPATQPVSGTVAVSNFPATQPISAAALPLPSGAATSALQQNDALTDTQLRAAPIDVDTGLTQPLTDAELRATPVPVSGTVTVDTSLLATKAIQTDKSQFTKLTDGTDTALITAAGEQNVIATAQPGVDIGDVTINNVGQQLMAASIPVVIASNQTAVPISGTVTVDTSLLATAAKQDAQTALLTTIDGGIPASLGQTTMAASMPVTIASNQSAIPVTFSGLATDNTTLYSNTLAVTGPISGLDTTGYASIIFGISGTWVGNLLVEGSADNSIWEQLPVIDTNEIAMQDVVNENGVFQIKSTTKYVRINVQQVNGTITALIVGRTVSGVSAADSIAYAMDRTFNMPLYVSEVDTKKDTSKALIPSDAPFPIYASGNVVSTVIGSVIDTTGYQTICVQLFGTWVGTVLMQSSNDGVNWVSQGGYLNAGAQTVSFSFTTNGLYIIGCMGRYFRLFISVFSSGVIQATSYLRQQAIPSSVLTTPSVNVAQIASSNTVTAGIIGVQAIGGNIAPGVAPTANPLLVAGIDTSGLTRRILTDTTGRIINAGTDASNTTRPIGVVPPASSNQNVASQTVQDTSLFEGQNFVELLGQLLTEMKINNQYLYELPLQLQKVFSTLNNSNNVISYSFPTEPNEMRNDSTLFAV